ncbi:protein of unknown function [Xenorhabdus nematophila AN6/1]|nr:protein of unknown function [Xenorhabdus nematophila AN6/1]
MINQEILKFICVCEAWMAYFTLNFTYRVATCLGLHANFLFMPFTTNQL